MGRIIFLLGMCVFSFTPVCTYSFPQALYSLKNDKKEIIVWSDEQICVPVFLVDQAISAISNYIEKFCSQAKIIIHCVSQGHKERSIAKVAKHEHEADYAIKSLLLDTLASKYEHFQDDIFLVCAPSDDQVIALIVSACQQFQGDDIDIFVASTMVKELIEKFCESGYVSELLSLEK